ncbi:MAG: DUF5615 family PIN-like protein [Vicinamibacteria bacterium]
MKLLLDESIPRRLKHELSQHEVATVPERGWAGKKNGELIELAAGSFDIFITVDQGLEYQQNLANVGIAVIVLRARTNRFADLKPLVPKILEALKNTKAGHVIHVEG